MRPLPGVLRCVVQAVALLLVSLATACAPAEGTGNDSSSVTPPARLEPGAPRVELVSATSIFYQAGPVDPVMEVRVVVRNDEQYPTERTTIAWDGTFARQFSFLRSEPAAFTVHTDGVDGTVVAIDAPGVIPEQHGQYRLWFVIGTSQLVEPVLSVRSNGSQDLGAIVALAAHRGWQTPSPAQQAFERGALSSITWVAALVVPPDARMLLIAAVLTGVALCLLSLGGGLLVYRYTTRPASQLATGQTHRLE